MASPALTGAHMPAGADDLGDRRSCRHRARARWSASSGCCQSGSRSYAQDPFDGQVVGELSADDADQGRWRRVRRPALRVQRDGRQDHLAHLRRRSAPRFHAPAARPAERPRGARDLLRHRRRDGPPPRDRAAHRPRGLPARQPHATHVDINEAPSSGSRPSWPPTDRLLRAQTGDYASYFRLPYEAADEASIRRTTLPGILRAQQLGYVVASHDFDPKDWALARRHGRRRRSRCRRLSEQDNITVLLHDGGGHRPAHPRVRREADRRGPRPPATRSTRCPRCCRTCRRRTGTAEVSRLEPHRADPRLRDVRPARLGADGASSSSPWSPCWGSGLFNTVLALVRARRQAEPAQHRRSDRGVGADRRLQRGDGDHADAAVRPGLEVPGRRGPRRRRRQHRRDRRHGARRGGPRPAGAADPAAERRQVGGAQPRLRGGGPPVRRHPGRRHALRPDHRRPPRRRLLARPEWAPSPA